MADRPGRPQTREPLSRSLLFLAIGAGELLRILLLALTAGSRLADAGAPSLAHGAWLLVYLAPHAVIASAFLFLVGGSGRSDALGRLVIPAKLLGLLAASVAIGAEVASGGTGSVVLAAARAAIPRWILLAAVAFWDFGVLAVSAALRFAASREAAGSADPPSPSRDDPPAPSNPVYREADVEVVDDAKAPDEEARG